MFMLMESRVYKMKTLKSEDLKKMLLSGGSNLHNNAEYINTLNVFPVPDGDTGTNMSLTVENGLKSIEENKSNRLFEVAKDFSKGLLMGARGNSGVITSQIFRGFYQYIDGKDEIDVKNIAQAFENGARVAYKAIMKPVEGTILTVIKEASWYANREVEKNQDMDVNEYFDYLCKYANESLNRTPDLLPVLKEVGVVDSGGAGLVKIFEGMKAYLDGKPYTMEIKTDTNVNMAPALQIENEEFGYCTEFILRLDKKYKDFDESILKKNLTNIGGESLVVVKDDDLVKVHVHMEKPGEALNIGQRYGEFVKLKIENMQEQHSTIISNAQKEEKIEAKPFGIIAVGAGEGITKLLKDCHVDIVVSGGQTMNPSTEDFVNEVKKLGECKHVLIFPNNSNIILAAEQVAQVFTDRNVHVIKTKSIPACLSCLTYFDPEGHLVDNLKEFDRVLANIQDACVTYAVKDTVFEGNEVKEGDYIAMTNKKIIHASKDQKETIKALLDNLMDNKDAELLTVLQGEGSSIEINEFIEEYVSDNSDIEVVSYKGDQPVYSYIFGLE